MAPCISDRGTGSEKVTGAPGTDFSFLPPPPPPKTSPTALPEEGAGRRKGREEGQRTPPDFRFLPSPPDLERKTAFLRLGTFI